MSEPATHQNIITLFGGSNAERLVSIASAQNVSRFIGGEIWFWATSGEIYSTPQEELEGHKNPFVSEFHPKGKLLFTSLESALDDPSLQKQKPTFFLALHGKVGEDGDVQKLLEERGYSFTGSNSVASKNAFEKTITNSIVKKMGIRVPHSATRNTSNLTQCAQVITQMLLAHQSLVLKPVASGSSDGLFFVSNLEQLEVAMKSLALRHNEEFLIEERIFGTEITVGVIERSTGQIEILPPTEVRVDLEKTFDYAGKYLGHGAVEITPAQISNTDTITAQNISKDIHIALGCRGYSRTDLILDTKGFVFIELNTLPGLTNQSFIPQQLDAAGIPLQAFIEEQIAIALRS
ncbi:MAG TPA: ATP-grasp domain-containing protein [Candidatus Paceibacterota bacterium]|nr:ATP-grasp domain-containing protein [Candidatus Paceibacterota bacterium]